MNELSVQMVNLQDEQRYMRARERAHRDSTCSPCCAVLCTFADFGCCVAATESTNSRVLWFTFMEATVLVGMSLWQVWTLRKFFETRADL